MFAALSQSINVLYALLIPPDDLFFIGLTKIAFKSISHKIIRYLFPRLDQIETSLICVHDVFHVVHLCIGILFLLPLSLIMVVVAVGLLGS